ncbi:hypothetical protein [Phycicoccus avicenniae]|uniref:hypothetical protein n=1 Tax=Phycicoccus avicenniae TaxID=2828860 RepID=UPI003D2ADC0C
MASVVEQPRAAPGAPPSVVAVRPTRLARVVPRTRALLRSDAPVLLVVVATGVLVRAVGLASAPRLGDAEGRLVAAAWATPHPLTDPTGSVRAGVGLVARLPVAAWLTVSGALDRAPGAVVAGREIALVAAAATLVLAWVLARRLGLPRWAAALAVGLMAVAPPAVELQRTVSEAGFAAPWVLAAFVLALADRRIATSLAAAACVLAVGVLTTPVALLALPGVALLFWRHRGRDGRAAADAAGVFALVVVATVVLAALVGLPVLLLGGPRPSPAAEPVVLALLLAAGPAAAVLRRLRPVAITTVLLVLSATLGPPSVRAGAAVLLVPFAALAVAGVADGFVRYRPTRLRRRRVHLLGGLAGALAAGLVVGVVAPGWAAELGDLTARDAPPPLTRAVAWVSRAVPADAVVLTATAARLDLLRQGRDASRVVAVRPSPVTAGTGAWWVVANADTRLDPDAAGVLRAARDRGALAAAFGSGERRVEVLRVPAATTAPPSGTPTTPTVPDQPATPALPPAAEDPAARQAAVDALLENPAVTLTGDSRAVLATGRVDTRLLALLAVLASQHELTIDALPESTPGTDRRAARIVAIDGQPAVPESPVVGDVATTLAAQLRPYRAEIVRFPATGGAPAALVLSVPEQAP